MDTEFFLKLTAFSVVATLILWVINRVTHGKPLQTDFRLLALYITSVTMIGIFGEIFLDTTYNMVVGRPLWHYQILPIHSTYTSYYAIVLWGMLGFYLYYMHQILKHNFHVQSKWKIATIFAGEALILESIINLASLWVFGKLIYFYTPDDLWHVTSVQNFPFYFVCGLLIVVILKRFQTFPIFFSLFNCFIVLIILLASLR